MEREEEIDSCTFLELQSGDNETYSPVVKAVMIILTEHLRGWLRHLRGGSDRKEPTCNAGDLGSVPGLVAIPFSRVSSQSRD